MPARNWMASLSAAVLACAATSVPAQTYPAKPIRLVVGFTPGGGVDINARLFQPKITEYLGQQVIVENRPGAGTNIANEHVAKSPPDGYTLLINTAALAINLSLYRKVSYSAADFAPISATAKAVSDCNSAAKRVVSFLFFSISSFNRPSRTASCASCCVFNCSSWAS